MPLHLLILFQFQCKDSVFENDRWSSVGISNSMTNDENTSRNPISNENNDLIGNGDKKCELYI